MTRILVATDVTVGMKVYPYDDFKQADRSWFEVKDAVLRDNNQIVFNSEHIFQRDDPIEVEEDPTFVLVDRAWLEAYIKSSDGERWPEMRRQFEASLGLRSTRKYVVTVEALESDHDTVVSEMQAAGSDENTSVHIAPME